MEVLGTSAVVAKIAANSVAKRFGSAVVERWTRYRAEQFFDAFVASLAAESTTGVESEQVDRLLDEILKDDKKSETLFDAYRRVCFSTSKNLGPRIIGLLTGKLVQEGRMADGIEESVFAAAGELSDGDFTEFMKSYHEHRTKAQSITDLKAEHCMLGDSIIVRWSDQSDYHPVLGGDFEIGSFPWDEALGRWAVKLKDCGLLTDRTQQHFSERTRVLTTITFESGCALLYDLALRSLSVGCQEH